MGNKGGRGKKALYNTTHSRIPENIKIVVDRISDLYKEYVSESECLEFDLKAMLPSAPAVYIVFNKSEIIYVGQTKNLSQRWRSHHLIKDFKKINSLGKIHIGWININDIKLLTSLEKLLIDSLEPRLNGKVGGKRSTTWIPGWNLGKTKVIRIPESIADEVMAIARAIDEGDLDTNYLLKSDKEGKSVLVQAKKEEAIAALEESLTFRANAGGKIKAKVRKAIALLKDL